MAINKISGVTWSSIANVSGISVSSIANIAGATPPVAAANWSSSLYHFEDQATQEGTSGNWSPTSTHSAWVNGTSAVNGTYWGRTENKTVKGWNCGTDGTPSGQTGPNGGVVIPGGTHSTAASSDNYLYSEASSNRNRYAFVTRMPGFNFNAEMADDKNNNLDLTFWVHAYGALDRDWETRSFTI